jgi:hypothetical protein
MATMVASDSSICGAHESTQIIQLSSCLGIYKVRAFWGNSIGLKALTRATSARLACRG